MSTTDLGPQEKGLLSDDERRRIFEEEVVRHQAREEIRRQEERNKRRSERAWEVANSAFGLWVMSSVVIGLGTYLFTSWQHAREGRLASERDARNLETELTYRLTSFRESVRGLAEELERK